jgi:hypothetical protein
MTNLEIKINTTSNDTTISGNFVTLDLNNDKLIWSDGSDDVADGQPTPTNAQLNEAAPVIPTDDEYEVPKLFFLDYSSTGTELTEISLAGSQNKRYVLRFDFDDITATEPTLEAWDDSDHDSTDFYCLGATSGTNSYIAVVRTTDASPGASWTGTRIAGTTKSLMNGGSGPIGSGGATIYYNIKVMIPLEAVPAAETPVLTVRYTWN